MMLREKQTCDYIVQCYQTGASLTGCRLIISILRIILNFGVPQGSLFDPYLFPYFINYLPETNRSDSIFADGMKVFQAIKKKTGVKYNSYYHPPG